MISAAWGLSPAQVDKLVATSDTGSSFGNSVSLDGDTALIGDADPNGVGAAYVFKDDGAGNWTEVAKLVPSDGENFDSFGASVSLDGDTALVGAYSHDGVLDNIGAAYIFVRPAGGWSGTLTQTAKLLASDGDEGYNGDWFGTSVSVSGNIALVGTPNTNPVHDSSGAVYVFERPAGGWASAVPLTEDDKLVPSDSAAYQYFGQAVSVDGSTAVIGAYNAQNTSNSYTGAAYVFEHDGSSFTQKAKLLGSDTVQGATFGYSVSIHADTVLVGAYNQSDADVGSIFNAGSAYVFDRPAGGWTSASPLNEEVKLIPSDPSSNGWFGVSVSIRGDFALVGLGNTNLAGAAYLYERPDAGWASAEPLSEDARLTPDDSETQDRFGNSVSLSGETALIGAPDASRDDNAGYIFDLFGPVDTDEDGVVDEADLCPDTLAATFVDANGCSDFQVDPDHDLYCSPGAPSAGPSACSGTDNCPIDANPMQEDGDSDGAGSVCDVCPGDATDSCDVSGSGGAEISVSNGGILQTPSGVLTINVPPGSVEQDVTITATQLEKPTSDVDLILTGGKGKGKVSVYVDFEPDGQTFDPSATLTFVVDVTTLKNKQIENLDLYRRNLEGKFEALGASCSTNDPPPPIIATCSVLIDHFSEYAFIAPSDTDGDEVLDEFGDELDNCPAVANPDQSDVDNNGLGDLCDPEYLFHTGFE